MRGCFRHKAISCSTNYNHFIHFNNLHIILFVMVFQFFVVVRFSHSILLLFVVLSLFRVFDFIFVDLLTHFMRGSPVLARTLHLGWRIPDWGTPVDAVMGPFLSVVVGMPSANRIRPRQQRPTLIKPLSPMQ